MSEPKRAPLTAHETDPYMPPWARCMLSVRLQRREPELLTGATPRQLLRAEWNVARDRREDAYSEVVVLQRLLNAALLSSKNAERFYEDAQNAYEATE